MITLSVFSTNITQIFLNGLTFHRGFTPAPHLFHGHAPLPLRHIIVLQRACTALGETGGPGSLSVVAAYGGLGRFGWCDPFCNASWQAAAFIWLLSSTLRLYRGRHVCEADRSTFYLTY